MDYENCPQCGVTLLGEEIPQGLINASPDYHRTLDQAKDEAKLYGWTEENAKRFVINCAQYKSPSGAYFKCKHCGGKW